MGGPAGLLLMMAAKLVWPSASTPVYLWAYGDGRLLQTQETTPSGGQRSRGGGGTLPPAVLRMRTRRAMQILSCVYLP